METTNIANVKIIINSSYVLIIPLLSDRLGTSGSTSPGYPIKHIILSWFKYFLVVKS